MADDDNENGEENAASNDDEENVKYDFEHFQEEIHSFNLSRLALALRKLKLLRMMDAFAAEKRFRIVE